MTISNHLNSILESGRNDVFDKLTEFINRTSLSTRRYRDIARVAKTADIEVIDALIDGRLSSNQFIAQAEISQTKPQSFEEIYAEIKDVNSSHETHLNNTADLFNKGVCYIEEVVQRILSPEYINTFDETDENSKTRFEDCLNRLDQIHTVISSLI